MDEWIVTTFVILKPNFLFNSKINKETYNKIKKKQCKTLHRESCFCLEDTV